MPDLFDRAIYPFQYVQIHLLRRMFINHWHFGHGTRVKAGGLCRMQRGVSVRDLEPN